MRNVTTEAMEEAVNKVVVVRLRKNPHFSKSSISFLLRSGIHHKNSLPGAQSKPRNMKEIPRR